jgi:hypothetical protein
MESLTYLWRCGINGNEQYYVVSVSMLLARCSLGQARERVFFPPKDI